MKNQPEAKTFSEKEFDFNAKMATRNEVHKSKRRDKKHGINGY